MSPPPAEPIQYARLNDGIVIIRVTGKGTHMVCPSLRHVFEQTSQEIPQPRYILDLEDCTTMDSTFMGTLASIGLHQRERTGSQAIVTNMNDHVRHLLNTLGLKYILDMRKSQVRVHADEQQFAAAPPPDVNRLQRILMMIEAHERLVDVDHENEVKFEGVLRHLRDSLRQEGEGHEL